MSFALALVVALAPQAAATPRAQRDVDWRSRSQLGLDLVLEFESEDWSSSRTQGGGTGYEQHGTIRDRVFAEEDGVLLGVRVVTRTNGTRSRSDVRFFRTTPDGKTVDDAPFEACLWADLEGFAYSDPLGVELAELRAGLERERRIELRDPTFRTSFGDPVLVRETVQLGLDEQGLGTVLREWRALDQNGLTNAAGDVALLALEDRCTYERETGLLRQRRLEFCTFRPASPGMADTRVLTLREVAHDVDLAPLAQEGKLLRAAFHSARVRPREALRMLSEWARQNGGLFDVEAELWLLAGASEAELMDWIQEEELEN